MMLSMLKETIVPLADLRYLNIECGGCHTKIILDLAGKLEMDYCPVCHDGFDGLTVGKHVHAFANAYKQSPDAKHKLSFRVPIDES